MTQEIFCYPTRVGPMVHYGADKVIGRSLRLYGEWAPGETALLGQLIGPGDRVLDIGANVGYHSLFFCQRVGAAGQVWAFEPDQNNRALLQFNLMISGMISRQDSCQVYPYLVGRESAVIRAWRAQMEPLNRGGLSFQINPTQVGADSPPPSAPLMQVAIDDLTLDACDLIKIDVEGAELEVLRGAQQTLRRHRPFVFQEQRDEVCFAEISALFRALDYVGYWSVTHAYPKLNFHREAHDFFKGATETNILWVPAQAQATNEQTLAQLVPITEHGFSPPTLSQLGDSYFSQPAPPSARALEKVALINQLLERERSES